MEISSSQLLDAALADLNISQLHPLHKAMLEECCENALANEQGVTDLPTLIYDVRVSFLTSNILMKGTVKAGLGHGDVVNINYRGVETSFDKNSKFIQDL